MSDDGDRIARAGNYVLGLMDDRERERAERDLEIDPSFRDAVVVVAERMHVFDHGTPGEEAPEGAWKQLAQRIADMPQMRREPTPPPPPPAKTSDAPVTFGRRRSDAFREPILPPAPKVAPIRLRAMPSSRALLLAAALVGAFALGYVAGISTVRQPPAVSAPAP